MASSTVFDEHLDSIATPSPKKRPAAISAVLHRSLKRAPLQVVNAEGSYLIFSNGQRILDTTSGAAVACIGYNDNRVKAAMIAQIDKFSYCNSMFFGSEVGEQLAQELIDGTGGKMARAYIVCSGSEAMEASMKMARQYYMEMSPPQPQRTNFIAREGSYHGTTLGALAVGGHVGRRTLFEPMLSQNMGRVSACNAYRGKREDQSLEEYVMQLAKELDDKFQEMDPESICAFVAEPVVGAALGCVPAVPGYFKAMKVVCDKYGALFIMDEVMSGMGRCGSLHAWEQEGVVPDIQTIGKGLGGGYASVAAVLLNHRIVNTLSNGTGIFSHGHTYQGHPVSCAAALEVQRIVRTENLVENVRTMGELLGSKLHELIAFHPHVGNIRGRGLFWGIEFEQDRATKSPFARAVGVANAVHEKGLQEGYALSLYPGTGTVDGVLGDHVLIAPAYNVTRDEVEMIAELTAKTVIDSFKEICEDCRAGKSH
ncbi:hypothetical protein VF21_10193 [Pseudogymnoascus sp. 05NY08]|nr:hypothetical protein VF21_10193 [Pseudogymnoascus sp. 05NY08]